MFRLIIDRSRSQSRRRFFSGLQREGTEDIQNRVYLKLKTSALDYSIQAVRMLLQQLNIVDISSKPDIYRRLVLNCLQFYKQVFQM